MLRAKGTATRRVDAKDNGFDVVVVGKAIEKDYPDVRVVTLAYWDWREVPPKIPEPMNDNVYVRLCQNGNKALPLKSQKDIMARLNGWNKIVPGRLMIWDWDACFRNYLTPYPTYHLYGEDFRTYRELGVKHILSQLPHGAIFADFVEMRTYLYAKLAWNPDLDGEAMAKEYRDNPKLAELVAELKQLGA